MTDVRDTQQLHAITGRQPATIRSLCRHLRGDGGYAYPDAVEVLDAQPGEVVLLTGADAERYLGIPAATIRRWYLDGDLHLADLDERGARLYHPEDLRRLADRPPQGRDLITGRFTG